MSVQDVDVVVLLAVITALSSATNRQKRRPIFRWAFEELLEPVDCILLILCGRQIAKGIRDGTGRAVSDGSFNLVTPIGPSV